MERGWESSGISFVCVTRVFIFQLFSFPTVSVVVVAFRGHLTQLKILRFIFCLYIGEEKHAKIIPVFKSGDELDPNNYGPISLLSSFNRIFEKLMYSRLKFFLISMMCYIILNFFFVNVAPLNML